MNLRMLALATVAAAGTMIGSPHRVLAQAYSYNVREDRVIGHKDGRLVISDRGVEFKNRSDKESAIWAYQDIRLFEIFSVKGIRIWTYEHRSFPPGKELSISFHIVGGEVSPEVRDFVRSHVVRPLVSSLPSEREEPIDQVPVEHLHRFGGCQGVLIFYKDFLVFEAPKGHDSRSWRWTDVRSISRLGPYRFEVLTYEPQPGGPTRSYNFALKEPLSDQTYELIWAKVFRVSLPSAEHSGEASR